MRTIRGSDGQTKWVFEDSRGSKSLSELGLKDGMNISSSRALESGEQF